MVVNMCFFHIGTPKRISELHTPNRILGKLKRDDVKMVVIDDEQFPYLELLKMHKFNIDTLDKISSLNILEAYDVILCDINGVGKNFSEQYQGAYLVKEIYKRYPFKIIISYTGIRFDARYNEFLQYADFSVMKDEESEVWVNKLDQAIDMVSNVEKRWNRIRDYLLENNVSLYEVMLLEDNLVRSVEKGKKAGFPSKKLIENIGPDLKNTLISFAASAAVRLLFP